MLATVATDSMYLIIDFMIGRKICVYENLNANLK